MKPSSENCEGDYEQSHQTEAEQLRKSPQFESDRRGLVVQREENEHSLREHESLNSHEEEVWKAISGSFTFIESTDDTQATSFY